MKFLVPFFLSALIIIALSSTGCKKDLLTGPEAPKTYRFSGKILSEYGNPLGGVKVQLNDSVKFSDTNGNFVIYCEANDTVNLQISDSQYFPITQNLSLSSDSSIVFHLLKVIPEHTYFPLAVGNKWSYEYYSKISSSAYLNESQTEEEHFNVDWEITAYHPETNTYDIKTQSSSGIHVSTVTDRNTNPPTVKKDTTVVNAVTGMFLVSVINDFLSIKGESYSADLTQKVNIRCTPASSDTLEIAPYPTSISTDHKFAKDIGLIYSSIFAHSGSNFYSIHSLSLLNYKLKQTSQ